MKPPVKPKAAGVPLGVRARDAWRRVKAYLDQRPRLKYLLYFGGGGFLVGYLFVTLLFFPGFGRSAIVNVPDLRGMTLSGARHALDEAGLEMSRGPSLNNPRMRAGHVLTQVPLAGQEAARGTPVRVFLSDGPDRRKIPGIAGMEKDEAIALLQRMGFQVRLRSVTSMREEGTLLAMAPRAGTAVPMPGIVVLTLSAGPPKIVTPMVTGGTRDNAESILEAAGLRLGRVSYDSTSSAPLGDVVAQSPAAGDSVRMGGSVRITLSGRDPTPPPPPAPVDSAAPDSTEAPPAEEEPAPAPPPPPAPPSPSPDAAGQAMAHAESGNRMASRRAAETQRKTSNALRGSASLRETMFAEPDAAVILR
ncbi:MAG TPA: PASTA domain-containing protein [Longimicrobium sp.]|nr:PASTA domain-containing protein [Longimicrobium sp.]